MYGSIIIHHSLENNEEKILVQMCRKMRHTYTTATLELRTGVTIVHLACLHQVLCACNCCCSSSYNNNNSNNNNELHIL